MWSSLRGDLKKSVTNLTVLSLQVPVCHVAFIEATKLVALTWKSKKIQELILTTPDGDAAVRKMFSLLTKLLANCLSCVLLL